jgi:hypothetical protein
MVVSLEIGSLKVGTLPKIISKNIGMATPNIMLYGSLKTSFPWILTSSQKGLDDV